MTPPTSAWSRCIRTGAGPLRLPKDWPRSPKSARRIGARRDSGSAASADAVQALVDLGVFAPHLLQCFDSPRVGIACAAGVGLGLALGGQRSLLPRVTRLALRLGLDEPACFHLRQRWRGAERE